MEQNCNVHRHTKIYRAHKTLNKMLWDRGYKVTKELLNMSPD